MLDKLLVVTQSSGHFMKAIKEWNTLDVICQTWQKIKCIFTHAYGVWLVSGEDTVNTAGYHGAKI